MNDAFQMSSDARFLIARLRNVAVGEIVSYEILSAVVGRPISGHSCSLTTARRNLLRDDNIVFGVVRGVGLRRLSDREIVGTSASTARKLKRTARRGLKVLTAVNDFSALSREDQMRHSASVSMLAVVAEMATEKTLNRLEQAVAPLREGMPVAQTLALFQEKKP